MWIVKQQRSSLSPIRCYDNNRSSSLKNEAILWKTNGRTTRCAKLNATCRIQQSFIKNIWWKSGSFETHHVTHPDVTSSTAPSAFHACSLIVRQGSGRLIHLPFRNTAKPAVIHPWAPQKDHGLMVGLSWFLSNIQIHINILHSRTTYNNNK